LPRVWHYNPRDGLSRQVPVRVAGERGIAVELRETRAGPER